MKKEMSKGLREKLKETKFKNIQRLKYLQKKENKNVEDYREMHFRQDYGVGK